MKLVFVQKVQKMGCIHVDNVEITDEVLQKRGNRNII